MSYARDFKGIWIPKHIWLNKDLSVMEKLFLVEIDSLDNEKGCFASNAHFSEMFDLSKNRCTEIIKSLESKGRVKIVLEKKGKQISKRIIKVLGIRKTEHPYSENLNTPIRKTEHPYSENLEGNNTSINNTKGDRRALDFLMNNYPARFEQEFLMRYKSKIKDHKKFKEDFNDKVDLEGLVYEPRVLFARLGIFARNWVEIQNKNNEASAESNLVPVYRRKIS